MRRRAVYGSVAAGVAALVPAAHAVAGFGSSASDSLTISSAALATPTGAAASVVSCTPGDSASVQVTWSPAADGVTQGYVVFRADGGGSAVQVGSVSGGSTTSFVDSSVPLATSVAYTVEGTRGGWTSAASAPASLTTPDSACN